MYIYKNEIELKVQIYLQAMLLMVKNYAGVLMNNPSLFFYVYPGSGIEFAAVKNSSC